MLLSLRKKTGLTSLFKEVKPFFKAGVHRKLAAKSPTFSDIFRTPGFAVFDVHPKNLLRLFFVKEGGHAPLDQRIESM